MKADVFIGIDPGLDGAVAIIEPDGITIIDTPTINMKGKKNHRVHRIPEMVGILEPLVHPGTQIRVALELVHSMPGQGARSMFSMGEGFGIWEGILGALALPVDYITPQRWKKSMLVGTTGDGKGASIVACQRLFPDIAAKLMTRVKDHGRADALLLADYLRRMQ